MAWIKEIVMAGIITVIACAGIFELLERRKRAVFKEQIHDLAQKYITEKETLAIRWHMGAYTGQQDWDTLSKVYDRCPEALCVHMADMIATHIMEVEK